eukprot:1159309-Pelagomonas_calceolata.AAC.1
MRSTRLPGAGDLIWNSEVSPNAMTGTKEAPVCRAILTKPLRFLMICECMSMHVCVCVCMCMCACALVMKHTFKGLYKQPWHDMKTVQTHNHGLHGHTTIGCTDTHPWAVWTHNYGCSCMDTQPWAVWTHNIGCSCTDTQSWAVWTHNYGCSCTDTQPWAVRTHHYGCSCTDKQPWAAQTHNGGLYGHTTMGTDQSSKHWQSEVHACASECWRKGAFGSYLHKLSAAQRVCHLAAFLIVLKISKGDAQPLHTYFFCKTGLRMHGPGPWNFTSLEYRKHRRTWRLQT